MKSLVLALLLCAGLSLSKAQCYFIDFQIPGATHCQDNVDHTWHAVGSNWRNSACMDCTCERCCQGYSTPRHIPDDCVSVFSKKECKYNVFKKDNPSEMCPVYAAVGK